MAILVVGSLNMDFTFRADRVPLDDDLQSVTDAQWLPGGHAANCASALAQLGEPVRILGAVGSDSFGDRILAQLASQLVDVSFVERSETHPTGIVIIPRLRDKRFMWWARGANDCLGFESILPALDHVSSVVVFDPPASTALTTLSEAARRGLPCYWAPNSEQASSDDFISVTRTCSAIVVNAPEFRALTEGRSAFESMPLVIRTRGRLGCEAYEHGKLKCAVSIPEVLEIDSTGAGDAFTAGFVHSHLKDRRLANAIDLGNQLGSETVQVVGARWSPNRNRLSQLRTRT